MDDQKSSVVRKIWDRTSHGFLFGAGLGIAVLLIITIGDRYDDKKRASKHEQKASTLTILDHRDASSAGQYVILGTVKNTGAEPLRSATLQAEFYLDNKFVDEFDDNITILVKPGEEENFRLACKKCDGTLPKHNSYKLKILTAY